MWILSYPSGRYLTLTLEHMLVKNGAILQRKIVDFQQFLKIEKCAPKIVKLTIKFQKCVKFVSCGES